MGPKLGRTCGDEIESSWSQTNVLGASVREMASGGHHETLNDHFNGANIRKLVSLRKSCPLFIAISIDVTLFPGTSLLQKLCEAAEMQKQHETAFSKLSATFSDKLKLKWAEMVAEWEKDPSQKL